MNIYELTYIVTPEITIEEAEANAKEIGSLVQNKEGVILKQTNPVAKTLAYAIKKQKSGFLGSLEFQLEPEKLKELEKILSKDGKIIRYMVIIKESARRKKERRTKEKPISVFGTETKAETKNEREEEQKVELKDIEEKLDEILGG